MKNKKVLTDQVMKEKTKLSYNAVSSVSRNFKYLTRNELKEYCRGPEHNIFEYSSGETIEIRSQGEIPPEFDGVIGKTCFDKPFVAEISEGKVTSNGITVTDDFSVPLEGFLSRRDRFEEYILNNPLDALFLKEKQVFNFGNYRKYKNKYVVPLFCGARIDGKTYTRGGHHSWVMIHLLRLQGIKQFQNETGIKPIILLPPNARTLFYDSLQSLGFVDEQIKEWDGRGFSANKILIPSLRRCESLKSSYQNLIQTNYGYKIYSKNSINWLYSQFNQYNCNKYKDKNIFISREDASSRNIKNRSEVGKILSDCGFEKYTLSKCNVIEQANLFNSANKIISVHGAGLTNIVFSDNYHLIEIFGEKINPSYFSISKTMNNKYDFLCCNEDSDGIIVDTDKLENIALS